LSRETTHHHLEHAAKSTGKDFLYSLTAWGSRRDRRRRGTHFPAVPEGRSSSIRPGAGVAPEVARPGRSALTRPTAVGDKRSDSGRAGAAPDGAALTDP